MPSGITSQPSRFATSCLRRSLVKRWNAVTTRASANGKAIKLVPTGVQGKQEFGILDFKSGSSGALPPSPPS